MQSSPFAGVEEWSEPPPPASIIALIGGIGILLTALAAGLGMTGFANEGPFAGARSLFAIVGLIFCGAAISLNANWVPAWLIASLACFLSTFGFPESWDSFRLASRAFALVTLGGALIVFLPLKGRFLVGGMLVMVHFAGILSAVTGPNPQPWLGSQLWTRVFRPYLQFAYLNNAYQFYSPDPGPATELWFLVEYQLEDRDAIAGGLGGIGLTVCEREKSQWIKLPRRPRHFKDPLGQAYYRRLSITEYATHNQPNNYTLPEYLRNKIWNLRTDRDFLARVPLHPEQYHNAQYREPSEGVKMLTAPSYIRHIAHQYAKPGCTVSGVKMYRVVHAIIMPAQFVGIPEPGSTDQVRWMGPYDPATYYPYYMGEYTASGQLKDRDEPGLYWLIPILRNVNTAPSGASLNKLSDEDYQKHYGDSVINHAGSDHRKGN